jgi:hypothetical protein
VQTMGEAVERRMGIPPAWFALRKYNSQSRTSGNAFENGELSARRNAPHSPKCRLGNGFSSRPSPTPRSFANASTISSATPDASPVKALGSLRARCRTRRRPRRPRVGAEVRREESEVPEASSPATADRLHVLTEFVGGAEATREETEVRKSDRAVVVVIRVADVSAVVGVGVVLREVYPLRAVVDGVFYTVKIK